MAPDRAKMGELHELFLAELNGGRKSKASGSTWKDQADGRNNELTEEFAFAWDGKSTRGKGITIDREMLAKIREQAASERPQIGIRFYASDDLRYVDEDWIAITAADFAELLAAARQAEAQRMLDKYPAPLSDSETAAAFRREREGQWMSPPPTLHGVYPPDLPPPPHEMWPCLVVDSRHAVGEGPGTKIDSKGYQVAADGRVTEFGVHAVRYDTGLGWVTLYVNDAIVRSGQLYVDGALRLTVSPKINRLTPQ